jgi:hypothetical protein
MCIKQVIKKLINPQIDEKTDWSNSDLDFILLKEWSRGLAP